MWQEQESFRKGRLRGERRWTLQLFMRDCCQLEFRRAGAITVISFGKFCGYNDPDGILAASTAPASVQYVSFRIHLPAWLLG